MAISPRRLATTGVAAGAATLFVSALRDRQSMGMLVDPSTLRIRTVCVAVFMLFTTLFDKPLITLKC